jgi:hypothetical protein
VTIRACLVEQNHEFGVFIGGSDVTMEATEVRSTQPNAKSEFGRGVGIQRGVERASVIVRACLIEQNHEIGVFISGSDATLEATVVRSTLLDAQGEGGRGIAIQDDFDTNERANVAIRACLVEQNHDTGVFVGHSDVLIEATVVRSTLVNAKGAFGRGITIQNSSDTKERATVTVHACLVEQNHEIGVFVAGSHALIEATVVRSTLPHAQGANGRGIAIQSSLDTGERGSATVHACLIEQNHEIGVFVTSSDATIDTSVVRDTEPQKSDNLFGDGIVVAEGKATIQNVEVAKNARAGIASFGSQVVITGGVITCNGFDLEGEPYNDTPFSFDGSTGWQCSDKAPAECTVLGDCHVETIGIAAPSDLPPVDPLPQ